MRSLVVVMLAVLASGCTLGGQTPADSSPTVATPPSPDVLDVPDPVAKSAILTTISVEQRWVKPSERVVANATAPQDASVAWFLAPRNPDVPGEENYEFVPRGLSTTPPGSTSDAAIMTQTGRYSYAAREVPNATFNVTVVSGLPGNAPVDVWFVEDAWGARFAPTEVLAGVNAPVAVHNRAQRDVTPVRIEQMIRVAPDGPNASFSPPILLGDYDLVALARDAADGWGQATARLIVDSRRPDANVTLGPWSGSFTLQQAETPEDHPFDSRFNFTTLNITFAASSSAPGGSSVRVSVLAANGTALATKDGASGALALANVPKGAHTLRVELLSGVQVSYRVEGAGVLDLVPPASFFHT